MPSDNQNQRDTIIMKLALRQGKCMLKLKNKTCKKEQCENCSMQKYLDDFKAKLPEYYRFRVDDKAESYVEDEGKGFYKKRSLNLNNPREKIIWELALRQGKCMLKLKDKTCKKEQCENCSMQKYLDDFKVKLPEYYRFCVDDEADDYFERELQHRKWENRISDSDEKRRLIIIGIIVSPIVLFLLLI